ncbi:MAG: flagellar hook assembly protein FlgD [Desulfobaccales bacterium]
MSVSVSSIPTTNSTTTASSSATGALTNSTTMGKDDFLKLLTAQLQHQDPLSPEDPKDFVAQLSQFSSLEQLINLNTTMGTLGTSLTNLQGSQQMTQGLSMLGKTVKAQGNIFTVASGKPGDMSYVLSGAASSAKVSIMDSSGKVVRTMELGGRSAGENQISWDGKDNSGNAVADGTYSFSVSALDAKGNAVTAAALVTGKVEEVLQDSGKIYLKINGKLVTLDNIISVDDA